MKPMKAPERWWPEELGENPSSAGGQNDARYAFFGEKRRLAVDAGDGRGGKSILCRPECTAAANVGGGCDEGFEPVADQLVVLDYGNVYHAGALGV